jgi:hypothetical protein
MSTEINTFSFFGAGAVWEKEMEENTKRTTVTQHRKMVLLFMASPFFS